MIAQSQISKLSNRLFKELGGRRIPEAVLERDYCIAWFLVGLSKVPLREMLAFKGGTALKRIHFEAIVFRKISTSPYYGKFLSKKFRKNSNRFTRKLSGVRTLRFGSRDRIPKRTKTATNRYLRAHHKRHNAPG